MKKNSKLNMIDVTSITKRLCENITQEEHTIVSENIILKVQGKEKAFKTIFVCPKSAVKESIAGVRYYSGESIEDYKKYQQRNKVDCHIATYEKSLENMGMISFDEKDDCPIKAEMNQEYDYVDTYFKRFLSFRNKLIENGDCVKEDDIHQYFTFITKGLNQKEKESVLGKVKKILKK